MVTLEETTIIDAPVQRVFDLARSIEVHLTGASSTEEQAIAGVTTGLIGMGESVTWCARHFCVHQTLTSEITAFEPPYLFQDTMRQGAFKSLQHDHRFEQVTESATRMIDVLRFEAPFPILGRIAELLVLRRYLQYFLRTRNATLKRIAESAGWERYLSKESQP